MESTMTKRQPILDALHKAEHAMAHLRQAGSRSGELAYGMDSLSGAIEYLKDAAEVFAPNPHPGRDVFAHEPSGPRMLGIDATDEVGPGGAYHEYQVRFLHPHEPHGTFLRVKFQKGPIGEMDANGVTNEALLAIVAHRLECFQAGNFPCEENAQSLARVREALHWLHQRTADRRRRGVEGKTAE